jgi:hypothetical protein
MDTAASLTLLAIVTGPIAAVAISLWIEGRRRRRETRLSVLRQLIITRHLPGDPNYSAAINLVPVEFNDDPAVIAEYKAYQEAIRQVPGSDPEAIARCDQRLAITQTKLIFAIMRSLKLKASEADLPAEAYAARGFIQRDNLYLQSLHGTVRIADALEAQVRLSFGDGQIRPSWPPTQDAKGPAIIQKPDEPTG